MKSIQVIFSNHLTFFRSGLSLQEIRDSEKQFDLEQVTKRKYVGNQQIVCSRKQWLSSGVLKLGLGAQSPVLWQQIPQS